MCSVSFYSMAYSKYSTYIVNKAYLKLKSIKCDWLMLSDIITGAQGCDSSWFLQTQTQNNSQTHTIWNLKCRQGFWLLQFQPDTSQHATVTIITQINCRILPVLINKLDCLWTSLHNTPFAVTTLSYLLLFCLPVFIILMDQNNSNNVIFICLLTLVKEQDTMLDVGCDIQLFCVLIIHDSVQFLLWFHTVQPVSAGDVSSLHLLLV